MPFKKGDPKPANSGRRKGQRNKRPSLKALKEAILETGFDTAEEMVELYHRAEDEATKLKILDLILRYTQPLPKVPAGGDGEGNQDTGESESFSEGDVDALEAAAEG